MQTLVYVGQIKVSTKLRGAAGLESANGDAAGEGDAWRP